MVDTTQRPAAFSPPGPPSPPRARTFTDAEGVSWTVVEVRSPSLTPALERLLGADRRRGAWLVFAAEDGRKRRLTTYAPDWAEGSDFELERWCMRAALVPPPRTAAPRTSQRRRVPRALASSYRRATSRVMTGTRTPDQGC